MEIHLTWDEGKRQRNLLKHGLDFADAGWVLESLYRLDIESVHDDERRVLSISYVMGVLAVLSVVHIAREGAARIISFRHASREEREIYHAWLEEPDE